MRRATYQQDGIYVSRAALRSRRRLCDSTTSMRISVVGSAVLVAALLGTPRDGVAQVIPSGPPDSAAGLARLIADAALVNARVPELLHAYRARLETEMSLVIVDSGGRERTAQLEQIASDVRWRAPDRYDQRVIGYRNQSI